MAHKLTKDKAGVAEALPAEIERKLNALEDVAGLLSDLPPEEMQAFLEAVRRRPLFSNRSPK